MASAAATERRRQNRRLQREHARQRAQYNPRKWRDRQQRDREAAARMVRRFFPHGVPYLIVLDYRYWQLRRCGWNPLAHEYRRAPDGKLLEPTATALWLWWEGLHYESRDAVASCGRVTRQ